MWLRRVKIEQVCPGLGRKSSLLLEVTASAGAMRTSAAVMSCLPRAEAPFGAGGCGQLAGHLAPHFASASGHTG